MVTQGSHTHAKNLASVSNGTKLTGCYHGPVECEAAPWTREPSSSQSVHHSVDTSRYRDHHRSEVGHGTFPKEQRLPARPLQGPEMRYRPSQLSGILRISLPVGISGRPPTRLRLQGFRHTPAKRATPSPTGSAGPTAEAENLDHLILQAHRPALNGEAITAQVLNSGTRPRCKLGMQWLVPGPKNHLIKGPWTSKRQEATLRHSCSIQGISLINLNHSFPCWMMDGCISSVVLCPDFMAARHPVS